MAIIAEFKNLVKEITTAASSVVSPAETTAAKPQTPNSINATEIKDGNTDKLNLSETSSETSKKSVTNNRERTLKEVQISLEKTCMKHKLDGRSLMLALSGITGKSLSEFNKLDENIQKALLTYVEESVNRVGEKAPDHVDKMEAVVTEASFMYRAITRNGDGTYASLESITPEQMAERRANFETFLKNKYTEEQQRISNLSGEEKEKAIAELKLKHAEMRHRIFTHVSEKVKPEAALELMAIMAAKDLGVGAEEFLSSLSEEDRIKLASEVHDFKHFEKCIKAAMERGEDIESEEALASFEKYNAEFMTWKNANASYNYQDAYRQARKNNELPEAVFKAAAVGIGYGAYINEVMKPEEKAAFISYWENDAKNFGDDDVIKFVNENVQEYIEKYPEKSENIEKTRNIVKIITGKNENSRHTNRKGIVPMVSNSGPVRTSVALNNEPAEAQKNITDKIDTLIKNGKSISDVCTRFGTPAVNYILKDSTHRTKFLADNNMIAKYTKNIETYIQQNLHNIGDKQRFVESHPKTLHIVLHCLRNEGERKEFASSIKGKICYTDYKATFKES